MRSYRRTQIYLPPEDHRRLRRLAAERGVSMTTIVREAVGAYLSEEEGIRPPAPTWWEPDYAALGIAPGPEGLADRLHALGTVEPPPEIDTQRVNPEDGEIGEHLGAEHEEHVARWQERRAADTTAP